MRKSTKLFIIVVILIFLYLFNAPEILIIKTGKLTNQSLANSYILSSFKIVGEDEGSGNGNNYHFQNSSSSNFGIFIDTRDNQSYKWVLIGSQVWMAENLRYTSGKYITDSSQWADLGDNNYDAAYCWSNNEQNNKQEYGALYTYASAKDVCPAGWHLPSDSEWKTLEKHLGMSSSYADNTGWRSSGSVGNKLKSTSGWNNNGNGTNNNGFMALPGGLRYSNGTFDGLGNNTVFWSATEYNSSTAWYRYLKYNNSEVNRYNYSKNVGRSVRCLKDF